MGCHFLLQGIFPTQRLNLHLLLGRWIPYHCTIWEALNTSISMITKKLYMIFKINSLKSYIPINTEVKKHCEQTGWRSLFQIFYFWPIFSGFIKSPFLSSYYIHRTQKCQPCRLLFTHIWIIRIISTQVSWQKFMLGHLSLLRVTFIETRCYNFKIIETPKLQHASMCCEWSRPIALDFLQLFLSHPSIRIVPESTHDLLTHSEGTASSQVKHQLQKSSVAQFS